MENTQTSINELFKKLKEMVELPAKIKKIAINIRSFVREKIEIDGQRLMQVLLNLTANGIKYTKNGFVEVCAKEIYEPNRIICIRVKDTGIGIKPENLGNIFKMFGLVDKKMEMSGTGIGIGLYLCKYIINSMGGTIEVESSHNIGTCFCIKLPIKNTLNLLSEECKSLSFESDIVFF